VVRSKVMRALSGINESVAVVIVIAGHCAAASHHIAEVAGALRVIDAFDAAQARAQRIGSGAVALRASSSSPTLAATGAACSAAAGCASPGVKGEMKFTRATTQHCERRKKE
jgi:hypothetical protein